jgi:hypothetical protein
MICCAAKFCFVVCAAAPYLIVCLVEDNCSLGCAVFEFVLVSLIPQVHGRIANRLVFGVLYSHLGYAISCAGAFLYALNLDNPTLAARILLCICKRFEILRRLTWPRGPSQL